MALEITLKPQERVVLGKAVVRNTGGHAAHLRVETAVPVLRSRDILSNKDAGTPCGRIYMVLQLLYLDDTKRDEYLKLYLSLTGDVLRAAPSMGPMLEKVSVHVLAGDFYKALQGAKELRIYEQTLLESSDNASSLTEPPAVSQEAGALVE
jgi:flagellar protein FlbT